MTGIEDFQWEEFYVIGPGDQKEYQQLKKSRPSYRDRYDLVEIHGPLVSEWMLFGGEDIAARVGRKGDSKEFVLGLAELKAVDKRPPNFQLLDDYAVFCANWR